MSNTISDVPSEMKEMILKDCRLLVNESIASPSGNLSPMYNALAGRYYFINVLEPEFGHVRCDQCKWDGRIDEDRCTSKCGESYVYAWKKRIHQFSSFAGYNAELQEIMKNDPKSTKLDTEAGRIHGEFEIERSADTKSIIGLMSNASKFPYTPFGRTRIREVLRESAISCFYKWREPVYNVTNRQFFEAYIQALRQVSIEFVGVDDIGKLDEYIAKSRTTFHSLKSTITDADEKITHKKRQINELNETMNKYRKVVDEQSQTMARAKAEFKRFVGYEYVTNN